MVAPKVSENDAAVAECEIYVAQTSRKRNRSCDSAFSSASLYFLAFMLGFAIMALYTQFVIRSQVTTLVKSIEKERDDSISRFNVEFQDQEEHKRRKKNVLKRVKRQSYTDDWNTPSAHLVGYAGPNDRNYRFQIPQNENYFRWTIGAVNSFSLMELDESDDGTMIVINKEGYYMVYSQVTYSGHGLFKIGHETVRIEGGSGFTTSLMKSINTQQLSTARSGIPNHSRSHDSNYHAGIFYFNTGDKVGVKPWNYGRNHTYVSPAIGLFFGMTFMHN